MTSLFTAFICWEGTIQYLTIQQKCRRAENTYSPGDIGRLLELGEGAGSGLDTAGLISVQTSR